MSKRVEFKVFLTKEGHEAIRSAPQETFPDVPRKPGWGYCDSVEYDDTYLFIKSGEYEVMIPNRLVISCETVGNK